MLDALTVMYVIPVPPLIRIFKRWTSMWTESTESTESTTGLEGKGEEESTVFSWARIEDQTKADRETILASCWERERRRDLGRGRKEGRGGKVKIEKLVLDLAGKERR